MASARREVSPIPRAKLPLLFTLYDKTRGATHQQYELVFVLIVPIPIGRSMPERNDPLDAHRAASRQHVNLLGQLGQPGDDGSRQ